MLKLLEGIKVLDLTRLLPGPLCTWYLCELGAEVLKIEPPEGDYVRYIPPLAGKNSFIFLQVNFNKQFKTLDLKTPEDLNFFLNLVKEADVVVESFRPGVTESLGIDFKTLKTVNPSIVYCSITGYGQTGPYKDYPGHDLNYISYAGILDQIGIPDGRPSIPNFQIADLSGGALTSCTGILAALLHAKKNQTAHYLDISMFDSVMSLNQVALATYQSKMRDIGRGEDLLTGGFPFYNVYQTSDNRFISLGALEFKFWEKFCQTTGNQDWIKWHKESPINYPAHKQELEKFFASKSLNEWNELLKNSECCYSPILTLSETMMDPHVQARGLYRKENSEEEGDFLTFNFPIKVDEI